MNRRRKCTNTTSSDELLQTAASVELGQFLRSMGAPVTPTVEPPRREEVLRATRTAILDVHS
jgi:hypothetical protein